MKYSFYKRIKRFILRQSFRLFFANSFKSFGKKVFIQSPDIIEGEEYISIGDNVSIGSMCWLLAYKQDGIEPDLNIDSGTVIGRFSHIVALRSIRIEKNVAIADKVYISDNAHGYNDLDTIIKDQPIEFKGEVVIAEDCWIGENATILWANIGRGTIIAAGSVVSGSIPPYSIVMGNPARVIGNRLKNQKVSNDKI